MLWFTLLQSTLATPASAAKAERDELSVAVYYRVNGGWGWPRLDTPEGDISPYRFGAGLGAGVEWSKLSLGLDFTYFVGSRFRGNLNNDPTIEGDAQFNAYRAALDAGYRFDWGAVSLQPHFLGGVDWQRLSIGEEVFPERVSSVWSPALLVLYRLREDGMFALGIDTRCNFLAGGGSIRTHFSNFLTFDFRF